MRAGASFLGTAEWGQQQRTGRRKIHDPHYHTQVNGLCVCVCVCLYMGGRERKRSARD